jgi:hypothetical protein
MQLIEIKAGRPMAQMTMASKAGLTAALILGAMPAHAAPPTPTRAPAVQAVVDCRKIDDGAERLACYDKAVTAMTDAEAKGDLVSIDREQRQAVRRQAFGLTLPSLAMFDRGEKSEDVDKVLETVASASQDANGRWIVQMQDGAVWRQIEDEELWRKPHPGSAAVIKKGLLGSFLMNIDGQQAIKVHRIN